MKILIQNGPNIREAYNRIIPLSHSIDKWFADDSGNNVKCLKVMKCEIPKEQVVQLVKQKLFYDFPIQLGFQINILDKKNGDIVDFVLSFFEESEFKDILRLNEKIKEWQIRIAGNTVSIATDESNNIIKQIIA